MELGLFMMPIHPSHRPVSETLAENAEKIILGDKLGYTEAWVGEHLTASTEPISAPLMFMASLLSQTSRIKFCTGVINMSIHHPALVAAEVAQFDHMSRGRLIFGIGPGALASDFELFKTEDAKEREAKTLEAISLILKIWTQDPPYHLTGKFWDVTIEKNVIEKLGFGYMSKPYQKPHPPIALSIMSPFSGSAKTAAVMGWNPISANFIPTYSVASHWQRYLEGCAEAKREPTKEWRVCRNIIVAPTDDEARDIAHDPKGSFYHYYDYLWYGLSVGKYTQAIKPDPKIADNEVTVPYLIDQLVIHGSPKTVVDKLVAFREQVGPFGKLILATIDWSGAYRKYDTASMAMLANDVMPKFSKAIVKAN
jgi:alkanesulfonate monooxygenase SsuD/methylene tetrahydromethanopterin reductase-like flavin-dependent oxidoreductase (luciferase family)